MTPRGQTGPSRFARPPALPQVVRTYSMERLKSSGFIPLEDYRAFSGIIPRAPKCAVDVQS